MASSALDFGDLSADKTIQEKIQNFHNSVEKIENMLNLALSSDIYESLTINEKINYDLFMAYTLNTLYWLYLRTKGEDPNNNEVKGQLARIKDYMMKAKEAHERQTMRPRLIRDVTGRFIRHAINYKEPKNDDKANEPPNKKIKLENN